ncbi:MAG TPA: hypothetical protein VKF32_09295, partial [Thermoanaerobaculia bacterium]|nr:hypothetical protein [Thermoanaerobaculia bacterium]
QSSGAFNLENDAAINVAAIGAFTIQSDAQIQGIAGPPTFIGGAIQNAGTLKKSFGSGTSTIARIAFANSGTVQAKNGTLAFTLTSTYTQTAGTTSLLGGSLSSVNGFAFHGGSLTGAGTITGDIVNSGAHVAPGSSPGSLTISGSYTQTAAGFLDVEIGGLSPGTYDVLSVTGGATLAGTLTPSLVGGFAPTVGNSVPAFTFASASGTFADLGGSSGLCMSWTPTSMSIVKSATSCSIHGDSNGDHVLAVADVFFDINFLFAGGPRPAGFSDVDANGVLNVTDVFYLINYLFAGGPSPQ